MMENNIKSRKFCEERWRPEYHFTAPKGWINDPNGLIYFNGWYHLFYQYNPYDCEWGAMHWGHAISEDMLHWKDLPIALKPDQAYDRHAEGGCFSGSAIEWNGVLYLFYSATVKENGKTFQTQCMAMSTDGINFEKYAGNPLISSPPDGASEDFRDPKVFRANEKWYMVVGGSIGGADCGGDGRVFLYESKDLYVWNYKGDILKSNGELGSMFECPDMFEIDGKWILTCSPMNHPSYNKAMYCIGTMNFENCEYTIEKIGNLDYGFDYYAPQSFLDKHGNRVLIAWQNGWTWMQWFEGWGPTSEENWRGTLSIPRKLSLDMDGNLRLYPVRELNEIMKLDGLMENLKISKSKVMLRPSGYKTCYIKVNLDIEKISSKFVRIGVWESGESVSIIEIDLVNNMVFFDRDRGDDFRQGKMGCPVSIKNKKIQIDVFMDCSCIEIYVNQGEQCITANVYPDKEQTGFWIDTPYKEAIVDRLEYGTMRNVWK